MSKLSQQMEQDMLVRGLSERTRQSYLAAVRGLAKYYRSSPDQLDDAQVQRYLAHLIHERALAWSSCNVAVSGLRFFYHHTLGREQSQFEIPRSRQPQKLPEVPSREEIERLFAHTPHIRERVMFMLAYGAGLRVSEIAKLAVGDIDSGQMSLRVRNGKGGKDRFTLLSRRLLEELRIYWRSYRPRTFLFPGRGGERPVDVAVIQKAWVRAKRRAGLTKDCGIHGLRHAFATHLLEAGVDMPTIQQLMGHGHIGTTLRYLHLAKDRLTGTPSPLDGLGWPEELLP